eukprot:gene10475-21072_t
MRIAGSSTYPLRAGVGYEGQGWGGSSAPAGGPAAGAALAAAAGRAPVKRGAGVPSVPVRVQPGSVLVARQGSPHSTSRRLRRAGGP